MTEHHKQSSEALFRFVTVSEVSGRIERGEPKADVIRAVAAREHTLFDGLSAAVSFRWYPAASLPEV